MPKANFELIEAAAKLWKGLEGQKEWNQQYPEILTIIDGAITRLRLEIILECRPQSKARIVHKS